MEYKESKWEYTPQEYSLGFSVSQQMADDMKNGMRFWMQTSIMSILSQDPYWHDTDEECYFDEDEEDYTV